MAKRSRFTRIREQVVKFFSNIQSCIREIWTTLQNLCIPEENTSGYGDFLLLTDISKAGKVDQCTNCEQILKVSMASQTDEQLFKNALCAIGDSADDCTMEKIQRNANKKRTPKTSKIKSDLEGLIQPNNTKVLNFNENYSGEKNRRQCSPPQVQIIRSPRPVSNQNFQSTRTARSGERFGEMRGESTVSPQRNLKRNFQLRTKGLCGSRISDTVYHLNQRSIGTSPAVTYADASCQTSLSIAADVIFLPIPPDQQNGKTPADCPGNKHHTTENWTDQVTNVNKIQPLDLSKQGELPNDSVSNFTGKKSHGALTRTDKGAKKNSKSVFDTRKDKSLSEVKARSDMSQSGLQEPNKVEHKKEKINKPPTKTTEKKSLIERAENETNRTCTTTKLEEEKNTTVKLVESRAETPHCTNTNRATTSPVVKRSDGRTDKDRVYGRENYIKVMLLKIVEKIPHIKKMRARQDSLPEGDPERERLYKAINKEVKRNINEGMVKFYARYNGLHASQKADTTELEKNFLMDLIAEMKKSDKEFLAEEAKAHEDALKSQGDCGQIDLQDISKLNIVKIGDMEIRQDRRLKQTQELKRQEQITGDVAVDVTQGTTTEVLNRPKHRNKSRHRKNVFVDSDIPLPDTSNSKPLFLDVKTVEQDVKKGLMEEDVNIQTEDISNGETAASEAGTSEDGDIIELMNDLEDEAHRDGLFTNWDATPFGDIAEYFDRGHYRIDGQTVVSKGKKAYKVEERPQKVKRRGIPNKHLANTSNYTYLQESAGGAQKDQLFQEDANETEEDVILEENIGDHLDDNIAYETLACLDDEAVNIPVKVEPVVDTRHLKDMPCDVILKKKGECDLLEEKYAVEKSQKNKNKQKKKKKTKKTTLYAVNYTNNADDEVSDSDDYDDSDDDDSDDESGGYSDDDTDTESDDSEDDAKYQARIDYYTEMLQSIPSHT